MHKKLLITLMVSVLVLALLIARAFQKDYLFFNDGQVVEAKNVRIVEDGVTYKSGNDLMFADKSELCRVIAGPPKNVKDAAFRIYGYVKTIRLAYPENRNQLSLTDLLKTLHGRTSSQLLLILVLVLCLTLLFYRRRLRKMNRHAETPSVEAEKDPVTEEKRQTPVGTQDVERFFLDLFRLQLGAPRQAQRKLERLTGPSAGREKTYKLFIRNRGEWRSRGMSISPLGEDIGSNSQCYYVIFDTHMVVKIPARPVKDFSDYIQRIRYEGQIVAKLAPWECIIPNISVIMHMIRAFPEDSHLSEKMLEKKYLRLLDSSPQYREALKIGGRFSFFMNLSRHYFLSHVLHSLHTLKDQTCEVITSDADLILDCNGFENKYGQKNAWICFELQKLFIQFNTGLNQLELQTGELISADEQQRKDWLFSYLAGQDTTLYLTQLNDEVITQINELLKQTTDKATQIVSSYKTLASAYAQTRLFSRNKPEIEGISANVLLLLSWLGKNSVAIRDLKPDNLFVAGNPENYPQFLASAKDYTIGLIDLETAVDYRPGGSLPTAQPPLGGTPAYATPSHFFSNDILMDFYQDLPLILHLQDWYAVAAIIYEGITGKRLFRQTTAQISELLKHVNERIEQDLPLQDIYREKSRLFWQDAIAEFEMRTHDNEKWLASVQVDWPESMLEPFQNYLTKEIRMTEDLFNAHIEAEPVFEKEFPGGLLAGSSHEQICRLVEIYKGTDNQPLPKNAPADLPSKLENLAGLKKRAEHLLELTKLADSPSRSMPARDLLELMFGVVFRAMYPEDWETLSLAACRTETLSGMIASACNSQATLKAKDADTVKVSS